VFTILKEKLPSKYEKVSASEAKERLSEGLRWVDLFHEVGPYVRGALEGDVSAVGKFWASLSHKFLKTNYVYFYFIDDLTGEPAISKNNDR